MVEDASSAYIELLGLMKDIYLYNSAWSAVTWESRTSLPPGSFSQRAEVQGLLGKLYHRISSNPEFGKLLDSVMNDESYDSYDYIHKRNIHLIKREYEALINTPEELLSHYMKQISITSREWEKAVKKNDWKVFEPEFSKLVDIAMELGEKLMDVVGVSNPYDFYFNEYEEGMRADLISKIFTDLTKSIVPMVKKYTPSISNLRTDFINRSVDREAQRRLVDELAELVGYDTKSENATGKLGETMHPFSIGRYDDTRVAVRFDENDLLFTYRATLHEFGHSLYNKNLNREWMYQPIGMEGGFGVHESQAKFLEYMIGFSPEFIEFFFPKLNSITGDVFSDVTPMEFVKVVNVVRPGPLRTKADELTFTLHIIIRFEIERDLFAGKLDVSDIPAIWNELYEKYLGVEVPNDAEGALQDVQWSSGSFGSFPCHTLGNIIVAQLVEKMAKDIPDWKDQIGEGDLKKSISWMTDNVHKMGRLYDTPELIEHVTGRKMSAKPFLSYLDQKFKTLSSL